MQPYARQVEHFLPWRSEEAFDLSPVYQRGSVWTEHQRQDLIRSLLLGIPIGAILVNSRGPLDAKYRIVDGKQRIETLRTFAADELTVPAWWWEDRDVASVRQDCTVSFSDLSQRGRRGFASFPVPSLESQLPTVEDEARLFDLINSAGTAQDDATLDRARQIAGR